MSSMGAGSSFAKDAREVALERALLFINGLAKIPECFAEHGPDLLWCFHTISATGANDNLRRSARQMGRDLACEWKRQSQEPSCEAGDLAFFISGTDAAERLLKTTDIQLKQRVSELVQRFQPVDFLQFDPKHEPPPKNVPEVCSNCEQANVRGVRSCISCCAPVVYRSDYHIWQEALVTTYTAEGYGVYLGASYGDVIRWIPNMRPYPRKPRKLIAAYGFDTAFYAITHVVYTLNDYGMVELVSNSLLEEVDYLEKGLILAMELNDPDMAGEALDALFALGRDETSRCIQDSIHYLLRSQNPDGSWGDGESTDLYDRFHATWTAVDALRDYGCREKRDISWIFT